MSNHFVYKDAEGTTTEWDDIQRKLGNLPPKPPVEKPPAWEPASDPSVSGKSREWLDSKNEEELLELEEDLELDDSRFLEEYRKKRLGELMQQSKKARFGSVFQIKGADFVREVSQAPPDVWVVVHLYKDSVPDCAILAQCLDELASKYPETKFVKIISTDCINNYPDSNLPTVLVYNSSNVKATLVGLRHFGGKRCTPEDIAFSLCQVGPVLGQAAENKVRRDFIERLVSKHEEQKGDSDDED